MEKGHTEEAVSLYRDMLYGIAYRRLGNADDAEDVVQEVFCRYLRCDEFVREEKRKAWLIRVTINLCTDIRKSAWHRKTIGIQREYVDKNPPPQEIVEKKEETLQVREGMKQLPVNDRNVIMLYYYRGYTIPQIAAMWGDKESKVSARLTRARQKLKKILTVSMALVLAVGTGVTVWFWNKEKNRDGLPETVHGYTWEMYRNLMNTLPVSSSLYEEKADSKLNILRESPSVLDITAGFEGIIGKDEQVCRKGNPWNDTLAITELPVFENLYPRNGAGVPTKTIGRAHMKETLYDLADRLGAEPEDVQEWKDDQMDGESAIYSTTGSLYKEGTKLGEMEVYSNGDVRFSLAEPDEIRLAYKPDKDEMEKAALVLGGKYGKLCGIDDPVAAVSYECNTEGTTVWHVSVYEEGKTVTDSLLNYNFNRMDFAVDIDAEKEEVLRLTHIWLKVKDLDEDGRIDGYIGNYPLIERKEAADRLCRGEYYTTVPEYIRLGDVITKEQIVSVELMYPTTGMETWYMPYYKFYVELVDLDEREDGTPALKQYGVFYVPAVVSDYVVMEEKDFRQN